MSVLAAGQLRWGHVGEPARFTVPTLGIREREVAGVIQEITFDTDGVRITVGHDYGGVLTWSVDVDALVVVGAGGDQI